MLPASISNIIPTCAQSCVASFISDGYSSSVCPDLSDVFCLCSHYDNGGYTLGEGALSCIKLSCSNPASTDLNGGYNICQTQSNHVSPTHRTLSITAVLSSVPTSAVSFTLSTPSSTSASLTSTPMTSAMTIPNQTTSPTTPVVSSLGMAPSETATAVSNRRLTTAQIIGVVVAALAALVLIGGAIVLVCFCVRRKRIRSVEEPTTPAASNQPPEKGILQETILNRPILYPPKVAIDPRKGYGGVGIARASQYRAAIEQQSFAAEFRGVTPESIGIAISPEGYGDGTPTSGISACTTSRLLPEKKKLPTQQQQSAEKRPTSNFSQNTEFEEDNPTTSRRVENFVFPVPPSPIYSGFPHENPPVNNVAELSAIPERKQLPRLSLEIPRAVSRSKPAIIAPPGLIALSQPTPNTVIIPPKHKRRSRGFRQNGSQNHPRRRSGVFQIDSQPESTKQTNNAESGLDQAVPKSNRDTNTSDQTILESGRNSCTSDTSFESLGNDPTPPKEVFKTLSPVEESPISSIRYPKVPRSSNQIVPRRSPTGAQSPAGSPGTGKEWQWRPDISRLDDGTDSNRSTSTLLAKRRGENAALEIERHLGIPRSHHALSSSGGSSNPHSPKTASSSNTLGASTMLWQPPGYRQSRFATALRNRVPVSNGGREVTWIEDSAMSPTTVLRSPMWEPRLTPTRRGDDLMLSVS